MAESHLQAVYELGQSIWYDNIRRGLIQSGELQGLIDHDAVVGITSNPTIFEKAINGSADYDEQLKDLVRQGVSDPGQIFEALAIQDIQAAADILRPIYDHTRHTDGYISLEVSPLAANDTTRTIAEARHLFQRLDRPNVMIKIPATAEGLPAIEQMIYEGVNINVTLIFSLEVYRQVAEAFIRGLEHRLADGLSVTDVHSVASFFVSRVDTLVDKLLDEKIAAAPDPEQQQALHALQGKAAIANARLAYQRYLELFHGERFAALRQQGAPTQRCLWASTSTKNPAYRDVLYVEELIGPETVDTMPPQTIVAFQDHGQARLALPDDIAQQQQYIDRIEAAGISMADVTKQLELEGVRSFADSFNKLMEATRQKTERLASELRGHPGAGGASAVAAATGAAGSVPAASASLGEAQTAVDQALERADADHYVRRVWNKDPALWKPDPAQQHEITDRLGWLTVTATMRDALPRLEELRDQARQDGFTHVVLLGMGGSSLAPEVLHDTFGVARGQPDLLVLDSTDPETIRGVQQQIDLAHTLFIVASKSGGTLETLSQFKLFWDQVSQVSGAKAGAQFIAITDSGTKLDSLAQEHHFRAIFRNPPDIGGRYSALSFFGMVPAALTGVDLRRLLDCADDMAQACRAEHAADNPGAWLGTLVGTLANSGRNKVTFIISPPVSSFGYWVEQLLAESTGKEGKGILPVEGEKVGVPDVYGQDRLFVYLRSEHGSDAAQDQAVAQLEAAGQPVVRIRLNDAYDLGSEFFRWEFATAIAGAVLQINAFDQPNVQESKDNTDRILRGYEQTGQLDEPRPVLVTESRHVAVVASDGLGERLKASISLQHALETFAKMAGTGDYIALLAYIPRTDETQTALQHLRLRLRDARRVATTLGYGPRFQHSTGQEHKGGPNTGVFIQLVGSEPVDVTIPGEKYTFGVLKAAQALGDLQSLQAHGRRVIRIDLGEDIESGLAEVRDALDAAELR